MVIAKEMIEKIEILQLRQNNLMDLYRKHKDEEIVIAFNVLHSNLVAIDKMLDKALKESIDW